MVAILQWWLFFILSYGVVQAFRTTRSFSTIYTQEELMARLASAMAGTQDALQEVQRSNQMLESLAATDPLTGAGNRRQFIERIGAEIARAERSGAPLSLLSLDLDHFKEINDSRGHLVGDEVLCEFVRKCLEAIRPYDSVARVGGEEFMVLLPGATLDTACAVGERLRSAIEASVDFGRQLRSLTLWPSNSKASLGMPAIPVGGPVAVYRAQTPARKYLVPIKVPGVY
jgi:diguanylate cyclase (GGDEF)-like protein